MTLAKNAKGRYANDVTYTLSDRHDEHTASLGENDGFVRFVVKQDQNYTIASGSGELLRLKVNVDASVSGTLQASIKNFSLFETNQTEHQLSDVTFNMVAPSATIKATGVTLNQTSLTLTSAGQTATLQATVSPSNASNKSVTWTSSNPSVATVDSNGVVTAVSNGTATITVMTSDGSNKTATCAVTVNIPVQATGVTLNQTSLTLTSVGQTATLQATVSPSNASDKSVTWTSSNPNVASVSNGVVTAVANGTATITVRTLDGSNKTATCAVTVNIPVQATGVTLNQTSLTLTSVGQTATLQVTVSPSNASNKNVTWTSSNPSVASVSNGVVTAVANGTATITVRTLDGSNKTATCAVTVNINTTVLATGVTLNQNSLTLTRAGQTATLQATVSPSNASNKNVIWNSSNPSVASVSNGVVTAVANGTATITVTTADGSNKTATCAVTVNIQTVNPDNHYEQVPVQNVEYLQNNQIYTATTKRASWYVPAGGSQLQTTKYPTSVEANPSDQGQQFAFINYEGEYYIYCVGEKKILNGITQNHYNRGELVINNCQPVSITETGDTEYPFFFSYGDSYNINVGGSNQITIDIWKTLDEGNKVAIQPVQGATLTQSELNTIIGYIVGDTIDENNTNVTNGYISYIGDPITSVNSIQANSYYLLTSVGRHGSDGQYLYESNAPDLCFEEVTVGHDINAAFQFEPVGDNQFRIKTISGNYIPTPQKIGWFIVSSDNPATLLIEPIKGVDDQFTLSCVGTGYYLDADDLTASMWHIKGHADGNGAYRIVYCEIERTTAIDNVIGNSAVNTDQSVYTIQGQRVTNTRNLRPGIYIIGGKKVLIK